MGHFGRVRRVGFVWLVGLAGAMLVALPGVGIAPAPTVGDDAARTTPAMPIAPPSPTLPALPPASQQQHALPTGLDPVFAAALAANAPDAAAYLPVASGDAFTAANPAHGFTATFDPGAVRIAGGGAAWGLRFAGVGRGAIIAPVTDAAPVVAGGRVEYVRGDVTEWYQNGPMGLEQGFTLAARPAGSGELALSLALDGATAAGSGDAATLTLADGGTLTYGGLVAWDATGRAIPARLVGDGATIRIAVDDADAVYPLTIDPFVQQTTLSVSGTTYFGVSVALSSDGNTALVGASGTFSGDGAAYVFVRSGTTWSRQQTLNVTGMGAFGQSVALSSDGNTALVGASGGAGAAYVYTRSGTTWSLQPNLSVSGTTNFGGAVALSSDGNTALVGASDTNSNVGTAYVFIRSGTTWTLQTTLSVSGTVFFGIAVALSSDGNTALVGSYGTNSNVGTAYVFIRSGTTWTLQTTTPLSASGADRFGVAVALSSDGATALVGAYYTNSQQGSAYVFTRSGMTWSLQTTTPLSASGTNAFGNAVALSGDGATALVGAPFTNSAGTAYVFVNPPTLTVAVPATPQNATVGAAFTNRLAATALSGFGQLLVGQSVTFTAPGGGESGTFAAGTGVSANGLTATVIADSNGVATAPVFTANTAQGNYTVSAATTTSGGAATALFSLTNIAGTPSTIRAYSGGGSAITGTAFVAPLRALVRDANDNPVGGATVTFAAGMAANGATATFPGGTTATTNASGFAQVNATANSTQGGYAVTATVSGAAAPATFGLANTASPTAPTVTGFTPNTGPIAGGTVVTITVTNFQIGTTVKFDTTTVSPTNINVAGTTLTVTAPAHAAGTVTLLVTNPNGETGEIRGFTYLGTGGVGPVPTARPIPGGGGGGAGPAPGPMRREEPGVPPAPAPAPMPEPQVPPSATPAPAPARR